jgi:hypothetical protein
MRHPEGFGRTAPPSRMDIPVEPDNKRDSSNIPTRSRSGSYGAERNEMGHYLVTGAPVGVI